MTFSCKRYVRSNPKNSNFAVSFIKKQPPKSETVFSSVLFQPAASVFRVKLLEFLRNGAWFSVSDYCIADADD